MLYLSIYLCIFLFFWEAFILLLSCGLKCICRRYMHVSFNASAAVSVSLSVRIYMLFLLLLLFLFLSCLRRHVITQKWGNKKKQKEKIKQKKTKTECIPCSVAAAAALVCFSNFVYFFFVVSFSYHYFVLCAFSCPKGTVAHLRNFLTHYDFTQYGV